MSVEISFVIYSPADASGKGTVTVHSTTVIPPNTVAAVKAVVTNARSFDHEMYVFELIRKVAHTHDCTADPALIKLREGKFCVQGCLTSSSVCSMCKVLCSVCK